MLGSAPKTIESMGSRALRPSSVIALYPDPLPAPRILQLGFGAVLKRKVIGSTSGALGQRTVTVQSMKT